MAPVQFNGRSTDAISGWTRNPPCTTPACTTLPTKAPDTNIGRTAGATRQIPRYTAAAYKMFPA